MAIVIFGVAVRETTTPMNVHGVSNAVKIHSYDG
jgi:hypothetical protein